MSNWKLLTALFMTHFDSKAFATEVIAHRGASFEAPENTLSAINLAWNLGVDAVEVDVHLSKDNEIVVIHDETLERTGRRNGVVADMTWAELETVDVGSWKDKKWANERIPRLAEVIDTLPAGKKLFIEIKCGVEIIPHLDQLIGEKGLSPTQAVIISFDGETLFAAKKKLPTFPMYHLRIAQFNPIEHKWMPTDSKVAMAKHMGFEGINFGYNGPVKGEDFNQLIQNVRSQSQAFNLKFYSWTINDEDVAKALIAAGVDGITTDHPDKVKALINQQ